MINYPLVYPTKDNKFKLAMPYEYKDIVVPAGYITNGANIPRIFWQLIPPFKPKYLPAVIIHDYLTEDKQLKHNTFKYANDTFEEVILGIENSIFTRSMIRAVKFYRLIKRYK